MLSHRLLQPRLPGKTLSSIRPRLHLCLPTQSSLRTPRRTMSSSAASAIRTDLEGIPGLDKWGWVIYRTTYGNNDDAWARFRARVERESRASIARSDAPEIADKLEWTWVEDATALDGISREELRERFKAWVDAEKERMLTAQGQGRSLEFDLAAVPMFAFFIQVDEEALRSVTEDEKEWDARGAHVKFVDAAWRPLAEAFPDVEESERDESYEEIDGCREENVGWMRISPYMLNAEFYDAWCGVVDIWHTFYKRPPKTVNW